jgi:protein involved in polysaccharide export with SLBB domain
MVNDWGDLTIPYPFLLRNRVSRKRFNGTAMASHTPHKTKVSLLALTASAVLVFGNATDASAQSRYGGAQTVPANNGATSAGRYNTHPSTAGVRYRQNEVSQPSFPAGVFQQWIDWEPQYQLVPGDQLEIVVGSAPELSRTLTVGPDGRIVMPMSQPVMAAGKTFTQVQALVSAELGQQLRDPRVSVTPRAYAPEQIYVGGQVGQPGTYTINNRIGALEAILMAGGTNSSAKAREVAILRRAPNGGMMMRSVNIRGGLKNISDYNDTIQLRRGDIVFVPATTLAEVGQFVQNVRAAMPVDFNLSYQFGANGGNGTTVITP